MKWYARELIRFMSQSNGVFDALMDYRTWEIGVGAWGSSDSYVVTACVENNVVADTEICLSSSNPGSLNQGVMLQHRKFPVEI